ncbi:MAG: GNAT family N-acetyltransferase [Nitriliruptoraceae bacterium]
MTAELPLTRVEPGEELDYARAVSRHFYEDLADEELERWLPAFGDREQHRAWVVRDGKQIVANLGVHTMTVSVPGGPPISCAGITAVGVAQTHRRRGLLRRMMVTALDEATERGEPVAMLFASESAIYGRFGFGVTAPGVGHRIDRGVAFRDPVDRSLVEPATPEEALATWPAILADLRRQRPGCVDRSEAIWRLAVVDDPPSHRDGASARRLVHVPGRGYARYRIKEHYDQALPQGEVRVGELVATDAEAEAALWQHVCDIDLTTTVEAWFRPPDDALTELLIDPLRARTRVGPPLYARLLDVPAALTARTYASTDTLSLTIHDASRDQGGTYRLAATPDGAEVDETTGEPDLSMPIDVAASVWLGGVRATHLLAARRLTEHRPGAAARLDRLVSVDRLPWSPFEF